MRIWIDVDNPPQVQYLVPFVRAFADLGHEVSLLTARDEGATVKLLAARRLPFVVVGGHFGRGMLRKSTGVLRRSGALIRRVGRCRPRPDLLLCASRSSALAAAARGIPTFVVCDYEHVELRPYRLVRSTIVFPDAIDPAVFAAQGFGPDQLLPFEGLKESFSLAYQDVEGAEPWQPPAGSHAALRVLLRPPADTSHYFTQDSARMTRAVVERIARLDHVQLVLSPRHASQAGLLDGVAWAIAPVVLDDPVPFVSLLKGVDAVVSAGGTMAREAAALGVPAYSIFRGTPAAVDARLAEEGRLVLLGSDADVDQLHFAPRPRAAMAPTDGHRRSIAAVAAAVVQAAER